MGHGAVGTVLRLSLASRGEEVPRSSKEATELETGQALSRPEIVIRSRQ